MAKIDSYEWYLKDTLKKGLYHQIPIYQRPYQWTKENCEKLLDDLFEDYEKDGKSDYFCGSLVLVKSDPNSKTETYDIVDGQQRLSTFILLAKVLADLYNGLDPEYLEYLQESWKDRYTERKRLSFNTIGSNAEYDFQDALEHFNDSQASKNKNNKNNYLKNAICLKNYLREKEIKNINNFIEWLYSNVKFITIICPNIDKALRIFNVLNTRGLALNATDIFKGELLKELAKEEDQKKLVSRWNALSQKCSDNDLTIETLFSWYLDYLNPVTSKEKMEKELVTWFNILNKPPLEYLKGVEDFYNAYGEVLEMQDRHAHLLSYKDDDYLHIILCASILHHYSDQDIEALKELLVKFYYQDWVAGQTKSTRSQTCCNIIIALKEKKSVRYIASIVVKKYLDDKNITQRFRDNLKDSKLYEKFYFAGKSVKKNSWLKPVLILVEYFVSDDPKPKRIQMDKNLHVEHILPQQPGSSSQWMKDFSEEERELYTHSLANLTLLG
ncbi:GmrSD restriction endonuclease domain-containing protein, partial [Helicobacter pylori]